jgi:hypothetical protein
VCVGKYCSPTTRSCEAQAGAGSGMMPGERAPARVPAGAAVVGLSLAGGLKLACDRRERGAAPGLLCGLARLRLEADTAQVLPTRESCSCGAGLVA